MNGTYQNQLRADEERIDNEDPVSDSLMSMSARAGRFSALARYYAARADFEAAERQRIIRTPRDYVAAFTGQIGGPSAEDIAALLSALDDYLRLRAELEDVRFNVNAAAGEARAAAESEKRRREEDLDREAAARSDDEYSRRIDDGLIGRSPFNKVPA